jgi:hypothetical protein
MINENKNRDTVYLVNLLSNLPKEIKPYFVEIVDCAMTKKELSKETKEIVKYACFHSVLPIDDEKIMQW